MLQSRRVKRPRLTDSVLVEARWTAKAAEGIGDETNVPQQPPVPEEVDPSAYALPDHELEEPTDTLAALLLLRAQFPSTQPWQIPIMLRSQVYSLVIDRTLVDRDLDRLRQENKVRMFRLPFGADHYCHTLTTDYVAALHRAAADRQAGGTAPAHCRVFKWFGDRVLPNCPDVTISGPRLMQLLGKGKSRGVDEVTDAHVSLLLNAGFLARDGADREGYVFALGNMGPLLSAILKGRKELLGFLSRRRYSQVLLKELEKKKLTSSPLGTPFHVRDLLGTGSIIQLQSTSGPLLRIAKKG